MEEISSNDENLLTDDPRDSEQETVETSIPTKTFSSNNRSLVDEAKDC